MILVGFVTDTQHVLLGGVIVNQKNYNLRQASALLFEGAGWANASAEAKDQLVLRFVNDIILGFDETLVTQLPAKFPKTDKKPASSRRASRQRPLEAESLKAGSWRTRPPAVTPSIDDRCICLEPKVN